MSELSVPSEKDESKGGRQKRFLSAGLKMGVAPVAVALVGAGALNWHWSIAAGLLPIIFCLLCCGAMYGLHLSSSNKANESGAPPNPTARDLTPTSKDYSEKQP